jgi:hypothetical protein
VTLTDPPAPADSSAAPAPKRGNLRAVALKLTVMLVAMFIALFIAEFLVRIFIPQHPSWLDVFAKSESPPYTLQPNASRTISTGESTWSIYTDGNGFRTSRTPSASTAQAPALLILGDSFPFGMGVNYEDSIPGYIDAAVAGKYRILNTGVPGYGPTQYRQVLERELKRNTSIAAVLVITYMGNDFHDCIWKKTGNVTNGILGNERSLRSAIKQNSHLYRLTANSLHRFSENKIQANPYIHQLYREQDWNDKLKDARNIYEKEFIAMRDLCQQHNLPLLTAIIPTAAAVDKPQSEAYLPVTKAKSIFDNNRIPFVDATPKLAESGMRKTYFSWDQHLSPAGNRLTADAIVAAFEAASSPPRPATAPSPAH